MEILGTMLLLFMIAFILNKIKNFEKEENLRQEKLKREFKEKNEKNKDTDSEDISNKKDEIIALQKELIKKLEKEVETSKKTITSIENSLKNIERLNEDKNTISR